MTSLIKCWSTAATIAGLLGSAVPALAQQSVISNAGIAPVLVSGDQTPTGVAAACGITAANIRGFFVTPNTVSGPGFTAQVTPNGTEKIGFTDTSPPDDFNGTPSVNAVGVRRNGTYVYCYPGPGQVADANLDAPGSGAPNQVTFIWGPGPCPISDVTQLCSIYNTPTRTVDFIQGLAIHSQGVNLCACPPAELSGCDSVSLPAGTPGSCIPQGQGDTFQSSEFSSGSTVGNSTCKLYTTTVGGKLQTFSICN